MENHPSPTDPSKEQYYSNHRLFRKNIFWYIFGASAGGFAFNTVQTMMPLHMSQIGMNAEEISWAMSLRNMIYLFLVLYISRISDEWSGSWGRRLPFLLISLPLLTIPLFFYPHTESIGSCVILFSLICVAVGIKYDTYPFLSYELAPKTHWGRVAGIAGFFGGIANWLGQVYLMPMSDSRGEVFVYSFASIIIIASTIPALLFIKEPPNHNNKPIQWNPLPSIIQTFKIGCERKENIYLFIAFGLTCSSGVSLQFLAVQAKENLQLSVGQIGKDLLQYGTIIALILSPFTGTIIDKIGAIRVIWGGAVIFLIASVLGYQPQSVFLFQIACTLTVLGQALVYASALILVAQKAKLESIASFCAVNGAMNMIVSTCITFCAGILVNRVFHGNYGSVYLLTGFCTLAGTLWMTQIHRKQTS